jgi:hypothetical protein
MLTQNKGNINFIERKPAYFKEFIKKIGLKYRKSLTKYNKDTKK